MADILHIIYIYMEPTQRITFGLHLNNQANRSGDYAIFVRITQNRKHKYVKTEVVVANKKWFNKNGRNGNWIRQSDPEYAKKNEILAKELEKAKDEYREELKNHEAATPSTIKAKLEETPVAPSFMAFVKEHNDDLHANGQVRYWKQFNGLANKLEQFRKKRRMQDILFVDLNVAYIDKFEKFLLQLPNEREKGSGKVLNKNTVLIIMKRFRTLTRKAVKLGYLSADKDPFLNYEFHWLPTTKDKLDVDELERIIRLDLKEGSILWHTRNCFLFSFYCAGIRAGDLLQLRWRNVEDGRLVYQMGKNHKMRNILLIPQAKAILSNYDHEGKKRDDYIFPLLSSSRPYAKNATQEAKDTMSVEMKTELYNDISAKNALLNKFLRQIAKLADIEKHLSFHVSRHSFAKRAKDKGIDSGVVQGLLAHSSLQTTEKYMGQFDTSVEDEAMAKIFDTDTTEEAKLESFVDSLTPEQREALARMLANK